MCIAISELCTFSAGSTNNASTSGHYATADAHCFRVLGLGTICDQYGTRNRTLYPCSVTPTSSPPATLPTLCLGLCGAGGLRHDREGVLTRLLRVESDVMISLPFFLPLRPLPLPLLLPLPLPFPVLTLAGGLTLGLACSRWVRLPPTTCASSFSLPLLSQSAGLA